MTFRNCRPITCPSRSMLPLGQGTGFRSNPHSSGLSMADPSGHPPRPCRTTAMGRCYNLTIHREPRLTLSSMATSTCVSINIRSYVRGSEHRASTAAAGNTIVQISSKDSGLRSLLSSSCSNGLASPVPRSLRSTSAGRTSYTLAGTV